MCGKTFSVVNHLSNMLDACYHSESHQHNNKITTYFWLSDKYFTHAISHGVISFKEVTNGFLQAFRLYSLHSKDTLSILISGLPSIFRATFQTNSQKRAMKKNDKEYLLTKHRILTFFRNWFFKFWLFFRSCSTCKWPETDGEQDNVIMFAGLHMEMVLYGVYLEMYLWWKVDSEWPVRTITWGLCLE